MICVRCDDMTFVVVVSPFSTDLGAATSMNGLECSPNNITILLYLQHRTILCNAYFGRNHAKRLDEKKNKGGPA